MRARGLVRTLGLAALLSLAILGLRSGGSVAAQDGGGEGRDDPASSRSTSFQAVEGPTREDVPGAPLLVGGYGIVLVLLLAYVLWLGRLQTGAAREIERLRTALAKSEGAGGAEASREPRG